MWRYIPLFLVFLLSGCTPVQVKLPDRPLLPEEVYAGYPCLDRCEDFKAGYEAAMKQGVTDPNDCPTDNNGFELGCKSYIHDHFYATNPDPELIRELEQEVY